MEKKKTGNYGFKFNPESGKTEGSRRLDADETVIMSFEGQGEVPTSGLEGGYSIQNNPYAKKNKGLNKVLVKERRGSNIGPGSTGFAGVATLASIIAIAGVIIAYLTLRY